MGKYYYLMSLLPSLPETLGDPLPDGLDRLAQLARRNVEPGDRELLEAMLSQADIGNFISHMTGRGEFLPGGSLTRHDIEGKKNLPEAVRDFLREPEASRPFVYDRLWEIYLSRTFQTAEKLSNKFLKKYLPWEIQLRNALATMRAVQAGIEPSLYLAAAGGEAYDLTPLITGLKDCPGPLEAEIYLDGERLKFVSACLDFDRFSLDALLGYLTRAFVYGRWENLKKPFDLNKITIAGGIK